jgi:G:T-mismatch repair DNA endonuclease (very short patch repair protein)
MAIKGEKMTAELKLKLSEAAKARWAKPEEQLKQSKRTSAAWVDPEKGARLLKGTIESIHHLFAGRDASWHDDRRESRLEALIRGVDRFHSDRDRPEYQAWVAKQSSDAKDGWAKRTEADLLAYSKLMSELASARYETRTELRVRISQTVCEKQRAKRAEIAHHSKDSWANPKHRENRLQGMAEWFRNVMIRGSGLEHRVEKILDRLCVKVDRQTNCQQVILGSFISDFVWEQEKVVLEVQGCRWHCCTRPDCQKFWQDYTKHQVAVIRGNDSRKRTRLMNAGYSVNYIWECDVPSEIAEVQKR